MLVLLNFAFMSREMFFFTWVPRIYDYDPHMSGTRCMGWCGGGGYGGHAKLAVFAEFSSALHIFICWFEWQGNQVWTSKSCFH